MSAESQVERLKTALKIAVAMRTAQKRYFKDRHPGALADSKRLEREFDKLAAAALADDTLFDAADRAAREE